MNLTHSQPQRISRTEALAEFFKARPFVWHNGLALEFAGRYAWRSRVSDARKAPYFLNIRNRQRTTKRPDGSAYVVSEYRYEPTSERATGEGAADSAPTLPAAV